METLQAFISILMSAISNCSLYSKEHTSVDELTRKALSLLNEVVNESDSLEIMVVADDIVVNKTPLREIGLQANNLIKRMKRKGLSRIDFLKGITLAELKQFVADISVTEEGIKAYAHIRAGTIDVRLGGLKIDGDFDLDSLSGLSSRQVEITKEVYNSVSPFKKLNIAGLEEIVISFILTFRREVSILKLISPVKSYSEYTYTHATNVAVLTMFQAETLGVRDDLLRDIGIAALLHDVGKLFISKEVLEKKGVLEEREWQEMQMHPLYGARYLAKINSIPRLVPIVAMEHHMGYDSRGYPKPRVNGKKQHICSQMVAISDFFDALRSRRPYKGALEIKEVISLMKKDSEGFFNPFLLDNFVGSMCKALAE
jgi:HD-GYP domain-containing protein (c-di-GMP phosphodiesterase class II)